MGDKINQWGDKTKFRNGDNIFYLLQFTLNIFFFMVTVASSLANVDPPIRTIVFQELGEKVD